MVDEQAEQDVNVHADALNNIQCQLRGSETLQEST